MARSFPSALWVAAVTLGVTACGSAVAEPGLTHGATSMEDLANRYLDAVDQRDTAAMHALRVTPFEHNTLMWPHFPVARPELNWSVEFAWENLDRRSVRDAIRVANEFGGRDWNLLGVHCEGVEDYGPLRVHDDCALDVQVDGGNTRRAKMFGSIVEMHGRYKIIGILAD